MTCYLILAGVARRWRSARFICTFEQMNDALYCSSTTPTGPVSRRKLWMVTDHSYAFNRNGPVDLRFDMVRLQSLRVGHTYGHFTWPLPGQRHLSELGFCCLVITSIDLRTVLQYYRSTLRSLILGEMTIQEVVPPVELPQLRCLSIEACRGPVGWKAFFENVHMPRLVKLSMHRGAAWNFIKAIEKSNRVFSEVRHLLCHKLLETHVSGMTTAFVQAFPAVTQPNLRRTIASPFLRVDLALGLVDKELQGDSLLSNCSRAWPLLEILTVTYVDFLDLLAFLGRRKSIGQGIQELHTTTLIVPSEGREHALISDSAATFLTHPDCPCSDPWEGEFLFYSVTSFRNRPYMILACVSISPIFTAD